jgi:hypothetical protein
MTDTNPIRLADGRDEMNLADFPLSALTRTQKAEGDRKLDRLEFLSTRFDPASRQRVKQKVTLTSTASDGLPTPADEHVVLALLHVAKHKDDFADATVPFYPAQLFKIMGWEPNGRSYTRLRDVLRRLKALTIRYENAWWDAEGRAYEEETATGIVSAYKIGRQTAGPRKAEPCSWVTWGPQFHESLRKGNLKRLNLEVFFRLSTPTAQRMYRFLDKRFYRNPELSFDLVEFACGHVGLTDPGNVALVKRRLMPGLAELESIGFLAPEGQRFVKVKQGQWRIVLRAAKGAGASGVGQGPDPGHPEPEGVAGVESSRPRSATAPEGDASRLARHFRERWGAGPPPGPRDVEQAGRLLAEHGADEATALVEALVEVTRKAWPECRSLSGAVGRYLGDAVARRRAELKRAEGRRQAAARQQQDVAQRADRDQTAQQLQAHWDALSVAERQAIEERVRQRAGNAPAAFIHRLCLDEISRM